MNRILLVDDEKNILEAYRRNLSDDFNVTVADSGDSALDIIGSEKHFQVIVSDFKMPRMNGVELLEKVRIISPDTIQIMLTGQADMEAIIDLINKGKIFRFLTKPCSTEDLTNNINDAVRQAELVSAEKELLGKTLGGSIKVLADLLALAKPQAFNKAIRIRTLAKSIYSDLVIDNKWQIEIAATLSQIGCVTIPDDILKKVYKGLTLSDSENAMFLNHPAIAADMIKNIPRMNKVAEIIKYQEKKFDGSGFPIDDLKGERIPVGARILKIASDYDKAVTGGEDGSKALIDMGKKTGLYDPELLSIAQKKFLNMNITKKSFISKELTSDKLEEGMLLAEDLTSASGIEIGNKNQQLTIAQIATIQNHVNNMELKDNIKVMIVSE